MTPLRLLSAIALVVLCACPTLAKTFDFSFSGGSLYPNSPPGGGAPQDEGAGQFTVEQTDTAGQFMITGVSGETNGFAIAGLLGVDKFAGNDNLLLYGPGALSPLTQSGVSYTLTNGDLVNLYFSAYVNNGMLDFTPEIVTETPPQEPGAVFLQTLTITPGMAQAPEPGTMSLVGLGLMGMVGALRRR